MSERGGKRDNQGRPAGARNRRTEETLERCEDGLSPLTYLLSVMRDETLPTKDRVDAAKAVMPYGYAKPVEKGEKVTVELPDIAAPEDIEAASAKVLAAVAAGEISTTAGQALADIIDARRRTVELGEIRERLLAIEAKQNAQHQGSYRPLGANHGSIG